MLVDAFSGSDPRSLWLLSPDNTTLGNTTGEATIALPNGLATSSYGSFRSQFFYDLRGSSVSVQLLTVPNTAETGRAVFGAFAPSGDYLQIYEQGGSLECCYQLNGHFTPVRVIPFVAGTQPYLRFRESSGTTYWELSDNGTTWTSCGSEPTASLPSLQYVAIELGAGTNGGEANPGSAAFKDVNNNVASGSWCPISSITDAFASTTMGPQWANSYNNAPNTESQGSGLLTIGLTTSGVAYSAYASSQAFQLTNSSFVIQVPRTPNAAGQAQGGVNFNASTGGGIELLEQNGSLVFQFTDASNSIEIQCETAYSATDDQWWRVSEQAGAIAWDTSPDGKTWTNQCMVTTAPPFPLDELEVQLTGGTFQAESVPPGSVQFANVNLPP